MAGIVLASDVVLIRQFALPVDRTGRNRRRRGVRHKSVYGILDFMVVYSISNLQLGAMSTGLVGLLLIGRCSFLLYRLRLYCYFPVVQTNH